jgi:hypothetical protein
MNKIIFVLLLPFLMCFGGKAISQVEQEEEVIIEKPAEDSADINTFYDDLSKDGDWISVDKSAIDSEDNLEMSETVDIDEDVIADYVWRPRISFTYVDWNPYTYGHWEFCRFGWVWVSDYEWGWAPYHYGRWWFSHRWGWVWSPGHRWAANWVSWCHTRHHIGWHPISPRTPWKYKNGIIVTHPVTPKQKGITNKWTFVSKGDFTKSITKENIVDLKNNKQIVSDAKITASGNEVFNTGPKRKEIEKSTGETISKKKVTFTNINTSKSNNQTTKKNNTTTKKNNDQYKTNNKTTDKQTKRDGSVKNKPQDTRKSKTNNETVKNPGTKKDNGNKNTQKEKSWISIGNESTKKQNTNNNNSYKSSTPNNSYKSSNSNSNNSYKSSNSNSNNSYKNSTPNNSNKSSNSNSSNSYKSSTPNNSYRSSNSGSHNSTRSSNSNSSSHSSNTSKSSSNKK